MREDLRHQAAKARVADIREFYAHLMIFVGVGLFLGGINFFVENDKPWSVYLIGIWGMALFAHWVVTFGFFGLLGQDWEERKIAELLGEKSKRDGAADDYFEEASAD